MKNENFNINVLFAMIQIPESLIASTIRFLYHEGLGFSILIKVSHDYEVQKILK